MNAVFRHNFRERQHTNTLLAAMQRCKNTGDSFPSPPLRPVPLVHLSSSLSITRPLSKHFGLEKICIFCCCCPDYPRDSCYHSAINFNWLVGWFIGTRSHPLLLMTTICILLEVCTYSCCLILKFRLFRMLASKHLVPLNCLTQIT